MAPSPFCVSQLAVLFPATHHGKICAEGVRSDNGNIGATAATVSRARCLESWGIAPEVVPEPLLFLHEQRARTLWSRHRSMIGTS
jgi:hypothetical protein